MSEMDNQELISVEFWADDGTRIISGDSCPASISRGKVCRKKIRIANDRAYSCKVSLIGKANARSSIEVDDDRLIPLNRADLR